MTQPMIDPQESGIAAEWLLIMERLKITDLAAWIAQFRWGNLKTNPEWRSWEAVTRKIYDSTRVTVSTQGVRSRWQTEVDAIAAELAAAHSQPDVPARDQTVGSTGPAGSLGSELPAGSNPPEGTR